MKAATLASLASLVSGKTFGTNVSCDAGNLTRLLAERASLLTALTNFEAGAYRAESDIGELSSLTETGAVNLSLVYAAADETVV